MQALLFTPPAVVGLHLGAQVLSCDNRPTKPQPPRAPPRPTSALARLASVRVPLLANGVRAVHLAAAALPAMLGDGALTGVAVAFLLLAEVTGTPVGIAAAAALTVTIGGRELAATTVADPGLLPRFAPTAAYVVAAVVAAVWDPDTELGVAIFPGPEEAREEGEERKRETQAARMRARLGLEETMESPPDDGVELDEWDARFPRK